MAIMAKESGGGDYTPVPEGTHQAICNMMVDLGLQETNFGHKHQVYIRWELPDERLKWKDQDGYDREGPMTIGQTYTLSLSDKANLRRDLQSWRGKAFTKEELDGFDISKILGAPCQVTVTHNVKGPKTYANVTGIAGWPKGLPAKQAENPLLLYDNDTDTYDDLPEWLQKKIDTRLVTHEELADQDDPNMGPDLDDSIPF